MSGEPPSITKKVIPEDYLEFSKGETIKHLPDLIDALERMDDEFFSHFVSKSHHAIADWILEGYHNMPLSKKTRKIKKRTKLIKFLKINLEKAKTSKGKNNKINHPKGKKEILSQIKDLEKKW